MQWIFYASRKTDGCAGIDKYKLIWIKASCLAIMKAYSLLKTIYYEKNNKSILDSDGYWED